MAKLYFRYGAMGSSKTANLLMVKYNYEERGQKVLLLSPDVDTRFGQGNITSRIGLSSECSNVSDFITKDGELCADVTRYDCILVDEAQFVDKVQIWALARIVDNLNIPVICYGLRTDFQGKFFPGSESLMAIADKIEEVKTICWCGAKATFNARYNSEGIIRNGEQVVIGANEQYTSVCRKHFISGEL